MKVNSIKISVATDLTQSSADQKLMDLRRQAWKHAGTFTLKGNLWLPAMLAPYYISSMVILKRVNTLLDKI